MDFNPYDILCVAPNADPEFIDNAYRFLSKKYHPDLNKSPEATAMMVRINEAYQILRDPISRRKLDEKLALERQFRTNGPGRTGWEIHQSSPPLTPTPGPTVMPDWSAKVTVEEKAQHERQVAQQLATLTATLNKAFSDNDWDTLIEVGEDILKLESTNQTARAMLGAGYGARGMSRFIEGYYKWAIDDFDRAIQLNPNQAEYYFWRGKSYYNQRSSTGRSNYDRSMIETAITDCSRAILIDPSKSEYYYVRGLLYLASGQSEAARNDIEHAAELGHPAAIEDLREGRSFWKKFKTNLGL